MESPVKKVYILGGPDVDARTNLAEFLLKNGFSVELLGTRPMMQTRSIPYTRYVVPNRLFSFQWIKTLKSLINIIEKDSIILSFDTKQNVLAPLINKFHSTVTVVRTINGMGRIYNLGNSSIIQKRLYELIFSLTNKHCQYNVFQNSDNMEYFQKRKITAPSKSFLIRGSGVKLPTITFPKNSEDKSIRILFASRLIKSKGINEYLRAAEFFANINLQIKLIFYVAGSGTEEETLKVKRHPNVKYLGQLSNVNEILSQSDIVVLQSGYSEGIPRILIEGAAHGNALITCDMPGCNDIVVDGYNGVFVQFGSSKDLIVALNSLISDKAKLERFKMMSIAHSRLFSQSVVFNKYLNLIKSI